MMTLAASFEQNSARRQLAEYLSFATDLEWRAAVLASPDHQPSDSRIEWFLEGFFSMIDYMIAYRAMVDDIRSLTPEVAQLRQTLHEVQLWRMSFQEKIAAERLQALGNRVALVLGHSDEIKKDALKLELLELMTDWGAKPLKGTVQA
jgi:hypothetical protein